MVGISDAFVSAARSRKYASPELYTFGSALEIRERYMTAIRRAGYTITVRPGSDISGVRGWLDDRLFLAGDWPRRPPHLQALTLVHEFVHVEQRRRIGRARFQIQYARPGNAWAFECQAYREGLDYMRAHPEMFSPQQISAEIARVPEALWRSYPTLRIFNRDELRAKTVAALS